MMTPSSGFPRHWPFVREILRSPVNSPQKGQWRGALMFSLICVWINGWVYNREAGDLRPYRAHYDVIVMKYYLYVLLQHTSAITHSSMTSTLAQTGTKQQNGCLKKPIWNIYRFHPIGTFKCNRNMAEQRALIKHSTYMCFETLKY